MFEFKLPDLGEGIAEAEIISLHIKPGDRIDADQVIAEVMTDKASVEISSPKSGLIHSIECEEGQIVQVEDVLFKIDEQLLSNTKKTSAAKKTPQKSTQKNTPSTHTKKSKLNRKKTNTEAVSKVNSRPFFSPKRPHHRNHHPSGPYSGVEATPFVRELAKKMGLDLNQIDGTGPGGRIMRRDLERVVPPIAPIRAKTSPQSSDPSDWHRIRVSGIRRLIAKRMSLSFSTIPHFTYVQEFDLTELERYRKHACPDKPLSPLVYIAYFVAILLPKFPDLNASFDDKNQEIIQKKHVHLGIASATPEGLIVPVLFCAQDHTLDDMAEKLNHMVSQAKTNSLPPDQLTGSTFTISSLGKLGGHLATPIINPPESAILGLHQIKLLPRYIGDQIEKRFIMNVSLSVDHRIADGLLAAQFIDGLKQMLESPDTYINIKKSSKLVE